jgi:hypothetical protein
MLHFRAIRSELPDIIGKTHHEIPAQHPGCSVFNIRFGDIPGNTFILIEEIEYAE